MRRRERSSPVYLFTGLLIGAALGLLFALVVMPVRYVDTSPDTLSREYKDAYRVLIARAYTANGDIGRAWARLVLLQDANPREALSSQARDLAADPQQMPAARALAQLAAALGQPQAVMQTQPAAQAPTLANGSPQPTLDQTQAVRSPTPKPSATPIFTPTITLTPTATATPRSSHTPTATLGAPYQIQQRESVCDQSAANWDTLALIEVTVLDASGTPVPGVRVMVTWGNERQDIFYTGLYPEISPGYADFAMQPNITYHVQVGDGGEVASGLIAPACKDNNDVPYWGRWRLTFQQP